MAKHDNVTIPKSKIIVGLVIEAPLRTRINASR
jgi:hypothetical protein